MAIITSTTTILLILPPILPGAKGGVGEVDWLPMSDSEVRIREGTTHPHTKDLHPKP